MEKTNNANDRNSVKKARRNIARFAKDLLDIIRLFFSKLFDFILFKIILDPLIRIEKKYRYGSELGCLILSFYWIFYLVMFCIIFEIVIGRFNDVDRWATIRAFKIENFIRGESCSVSMENEFILPSVLVDCIGRIDNIDVNQRRGLLFVKYIDCKHRPRYTDIGKLIEWYYKTNNNRGGKTVAILWKEYNFGFTEKARSLDFDESLMEEDYVLFPTHHDMGLKVVDYQPDESVEESFKIIDVELEE